MSFPKKTWSFGSITLDILAVTAFFWQTAPIAWLLTGIVLTIALLLAADWRGRLAVKNMIEIKFRALQLAIIPMALASITFFSLLLYIANLDTSQLALARKPFDYTIQTSENLIKRVLPQFSKEVNFGELLIMVAQRVNPDLPPLAHQMLVEKIKGELTESSGIAINPNEGAADVFYKIINGFLGRIPENFKLPLVAGFGLILFLSINSSAFAFIWLIGLIARLIYEIMLTSNFASTKLEKAYKEVVSL